MTRVNVVPVTELSRQHLVAEYRELPRLFNLVRAAYWRGATGQMYRDAYPHYRMGVGHVLFFYGRLGFVVERCIQLKDEMLRRGYNPVHKADAIDVTGIDNDWFGYWTPTAEALEFNRARIRERS